LRIIRMWYWDGEITKSRNAMAYIDLSVLLYAPFVLVILGVFGASFAVRYL
jgi:hypothetical protein